MLANAIAAHPALVLVPLAIFVAIIAVCALLVIRYGPGSE